MQNLVGCVITFLPGEADIAWQDAAELRDFLLQNSDSEDPDVSELPDPQLDSEAEVMACYYKNQSSGPPQPTEMSNKYSTASFIPTSAFQFEQLSEKNTKYKMTCVVMQKQHAVNRLPRVRDAAISEALTIIGKYTL